MQDDQNQRSLKYDYSGTSEAFKDLNFPSTWVVKAGQHDEYYSYYKADFF